MTSNSKIFSENLAPPSSISYIFLPFLKLFSSFPVSLSWDSIVTNVLSIKAIVLVANWFLLSNCLLISILTVAFKYSTILALLVPCIPKVIIEPPLSSDLTLIPLYPDTVPLKSLNCTKYSFPV